MSLHSYRSGRGAWRMDAYVLSPQPEFGFCAARDEIARSVAGLVDGLWLTIAYMYIKATN